MTEQEYGAGGEREPQQTDHARGRHDGITAMTGKVSFGTGGAASLDMTITGGSTTGTGSFKATGAQGDSIGADPTERTGSLTSKTERGNTEYHVTASNLPAAASSKDYTVRVSYTLNNTTMYLEGTAVQPLTIPGSADVSMAQVAPPPG
jgi:hypothetical protein